MHRIKNIKNIFIHLDIEFGMPVDQWNTEYRKALDMIG